MCITPISYASDVFTVVIDAGHGGKDSGACDNGVKEKDINLGVARQLASQLKNIKGVKTVLTRDKDEYLTLQQRADIANNAKGNIFISIHTNSAAADNPNRSKAAGSSSHILGVSKDANNLAVTQRENSVIKLEKNYQTKYQGFDPDNDESYIIFEMMQKNNQKRSIYLAEEIQKGLSTTAQRRDRGVYQNAFWVLWATSMPSVLVELDFICNPNSAKYISSPEGQTKLAQGICNAINNYIKNHNVRAYEETSFSTSEDITVLASADINQDNPRQHVNQPTSSNSSGQRKRRSMASKVKSNQKNFESEDIVVVNNDVENKNTSSSSEEKNQPQSPTHDTKNKAKAAKHATKNRTVREVIAASDSMEEYKHDKEEKEKEKKNPNKEEKIKIKPDKPSKIASTTKPKTNNKKVIKVTTATRNTTEIQTGIAEAFGGETTSNIAPASNVSNIQYTTEPIAEPTTNITNNNQNKQGKAKRAHLNTKI